MKYQRVPMCPAALDTTVARYNSFVVSGVDSDFGKPTPAYKIVEPPFHAAWATPTPHDSRAGLRINAKCQVIDRAGQIIRGLYCAGESAGGLASTVSPARWCKASSPVAMRYVNHLADPALRSRRRAGIDEPPSAVYSANRPR
jgi:hypothetical protein